MTKYQKSTLPERGFHTGGAIGVSTESADNPIFEAARDPEGNWTQSGYYWGKERR